MFRWKVTFSALGLLLLLGVAPAQAAQMLPDPLRSGGIGVFDALTKRASASGGDFTPAEITKEELSTILWAATGANRGANGWTVPMWRGVPPYCRVFVAGNDGVFLYDWKNNALEQLSEENIKGKIGKQSFVKKAYYVLIFVSDAESLAQFKSEDITRDFAHVAVGAMTQNAYLACASLKVNARYVHSMYKDEVIKALQLPEGDTPIAFLLLGK